MGRSNHMSGKRELFAKFDEFIRGKIKFGNNTLLLVFGKKKSVLV